MATDKYKKIRQELETVNATLPDSFFEGEPAEMQHCIFMISCLGKDRFLYLDDHFKSITGYPKQRFLEEGMDFWSYLMCPDDMDAVSSKIIQAHQALLNPTHKQKQPEPLVLDYRFRHAKGHWVQLRDTRYLVSFNQEKVIDKVVCRFDVFPGENKDDLINLVQEQASCTRLLETALVHQHSKSRQTLDNLQLPSTNLDTPSAVNLTKREKELLKLISEGLSSKMIAAKCHISIHTVETHRRHLLQKFEVNNSMELIKKASKIYWL